MKALSSNGTSFTLLGLDALRAVHVTPTLLGPTRSVLATPEQSIFAAQQPILSHGENGFSKKGLNPDDASYYYSIPQLLVSGTLTRNGEPQK